MENSWRKFPGLLEIQKKSENQKRPSLFKWLSHQAPHSEDLSLCVCMESYRPSDYVHMDTECFSANWMLIKCTLEKFCFKESLGNLFLFCYSYFMYALLSVLRKLIDNNKLQRKPRLEFSSRKSPNIGKKQHCTCTVSSRGQTIRENSEAKFWGPNSLELKPWKYHGR